MYFPDLSEYTYTRTKVPGTILNVGWLSHSNEFTVGVIEHHLFEKLKHLWLAAPVAQMRGYHYCEYCHVDDIAVSHNGRSHFLGSSELWVPADGGKIIYACPSMILHYIDSHHYLPPRVFLKSLADFNEEPRSIYDLWRASTDEL